MESRDLREQNELADRLIAKLERIDELSRSIADNLEKIKGLLDKMPNKIKLSEFDQQIGSIADNLERAKTTWNAHEFPGIEGGNDTLDVYGRVTGAIGRFYRVPGS